MSTAYPAPTLAGFQAWAVPQGFTYTVLPQASIYWCYAFDTAVAVVNLQLQCASALAYMLGIYNLATDNLINWAPDTAPSTFWADLRTKFGAYNFIGGTVVSASDEGTSDSLATVESLTNLTIGQLQNLKTPWGRQYLAFAQEVGSQWGVT
jgi:hypothetical protein